MLTSTCKKQVPVVAYCQQHTLFCSIISQLPVDIFRCGMIAMISVYSPKSGKVFILSFFHMCVLCVLIWKYFFFLHCTHPSVCIGAFSDSPHNPSICQTYEWPSLSLSLCLLYLCLWFSSHITFCSHHDNNSKSLHLWFMICDTCCYHRLKFTRQRGSGGSKLIHYSQSGLIQAIQ